jgi:hypothetical protein
MKKIICSLPFLLFFLVPAKLFAQDCPDSCTYFMPNTLTVDGDCFGCEILEITANCTFSQFDFTLYDKWGNEHFHSTDPRMKFDSAGSPQGTYFWVFEAQYCNGKRFSHDGRITIIW